MRKLFVSLALSIGAVMIATSSVGALSSPSTGSARLHPYDRSGVKASMTFFDTHDEIAGLIVNGTATGLDPNKKYVSLISDNDSVPGGPQACEFSDDSFDEEEMFAGSWHVNADGTATLFFVMSEGGYVPLSDYRARGEAIPPRNEKASTGISAHSA
jgi:hypothetical protein